MRVEECHLTVDEDVLATQADGDVDGGPRAINTGYGKGTEGEVVDASVDEDLVVCNRAGSFDALAEEDHGGFEGEALRVYEGTDDCSEGAYVEADIFEVEDLGRLGDVEVGDGASQGDEVVDIETLEFALDKLAY